MSLNDASKNSGIIGGPISKEVADQLQARKKIIQSPDKNNDTYINFANGSTGWVRISSSVDTPSPTQERSSLLAQQNVLQGGTLAFGNFKRQGILGENSSYSNTELGFRPMAGITGFTVQNRSYAGALRSGTFEMTLTSIDQLSTLEKLYMRPGFTIFIEYGHSIFVETSGKLSTNATYVQKYFELTSKKEIVSAGNLIRDKVTNFNYDCMYAYVTNFTWQSTEIGLYDVSVSFVTAGDLIDSLSTAISGGGKIKIKKDASKTLENRATALHTVLWTINNADTEKYYDSETLQDDEDYSTKLQCIDDALNENCQPIWDDIKKSYSDNGREFNLTRVGIGSTKSQGSWFRYISMGFLLECINYLLIPVTSKKERIFTFNIEKYSPFTTFTRHLCLDPGVGFLPKVRNSTTETNFKFLFAEQDSRIKDPSDILNIGLNVDFVLRLLDNLIESEEVTDASLYAFVTSILRRLNVELGGINDLDIHFDDDAEELFIIDRTVIPDYEVINQDTRYKLDIFGKGSTVESFNLSSTVPSSMAAVVAASAGTTSSDVRNKLHSMFRWNEGLVDRTVETLVFDEVYDNEALDSFRDELILFARYVYNINVSPFIINHNPESVNGVRSLHKKLTSIFLEYYTNFPEESQRKINASGLIPIQLDLTMKGISGIKIGQAFTIQDELLPERYRGRVAFLIKHLSNTVVENRWITEINAMMFSLDVPEDTSNEVQKIPEITVEDLEKEFTNVTLPPRIETPDITFSKFFDILKERNDGRGKGFYGAPRESGIHLGWDVEAPTGTIIKAPLDGTIVQQIGFGKYDHPALKITGTGDYVGWEFWLGYCEWLNKPVLVKNEDGSSSPITVKKGQPIGKVTQLSVRYTSPLFTAYPEDMINHVHIRVDYNKQTINPKSLTYI
jgi:hypothetical protein